MKRWIHRYVHIVYLKGTCKRTLDMAVCDILLLIPEIFSLQFPSVLCKLVISPLKLIGPPLPSSHFHFLCSYLNKY